MFRLGRQFMAESGTCISIPDSWQMETQGQLSGYGRLRPGADLPEVAAKQPLVPFECMLSGYM